MSLLNHLMTRSLLYFTSIILTHRPFWSIPAEYQVCLEASQSMEKLVLLLESTFGLGNITYLMGYCIYTGASVSLEDAKKTNNPAHATLHTFLRALNSGMQRCRLFERSINIIIKEMSHISQEQELLGERIAPSEPAAVTGGYIPAFPYVDSMGIMESPFGTDFNHADVNSLQILDCYPEMQMDLSGMFGEMG